MILINKTKFKPTTVYYDTLMRTYVIYAYTIE